MAKQMTEEEKKVRAERLKEAREAKKAKAEEEKESIVEDSTQDTTHEAVTPVVQVLAPKDPVVKILYVDSALPNNQVPIGPGRYVTGSGRIFTKTLSEFEGEFMTPLTMLLIDQRKFVVLSGLDDEQRTQYNCNYAEGEVIKSEGTFDYLFRCSVENAVEIYEALCKEHRELVARRFISAFENGDNRITRDRMEALNEISKKDYEDGKGMFTEIIKSMNEKTL